MKKIITYLILAAPFTLLAQSLERQVIASNGSNTIIIGTVGISQTFGEPMVKSFTTSVLRISEGFQQTSSTMVAREEFTAEDISIVAYPNPVEDMLMIDITTQGPLGLSLRFHDVLGREIKLEKPEINVAGTVTESIDCTNLAAGTYFLRIQDQNSGAVKSLRIEKIR